MAGTGQLVLRLGTASLLIACSFAFWHSGAGADALCKHERFVSAARVSVWPPGASCTFGEPATTDTLLNPWFFGTLLLVLPLALEAFESHGATISFVDEMGRRPQAGLPWFAVGWLACARA